MAHLMSWLALFSCAHRAPVVAPEADAYARELAADDPVHVWDLDDGPADGPVPGDPAGAPKAAVPLEGASFGTTAATVEAWVRGAGTVATYTLPDGRVPLVISVAEDGAIAVTVPSGDAPDGTTSATGHPGDVPQDGAWHHVAVAWDGATTRIHNLEVAVDGRNVWFTMARDGDLPDGGVMTAGPYAGGLDHVAFYDRYLHESALLGHVFVARGARPARTPWAELPIEVAPTFGTQGGVFGLDVSPDGRLVATGGADGVTVWDLDAGVPIRRFGAGETASVAFSADGAWVWAATGEVVSAWGAATGEVQATFSAGDPVRSLAPVSDGRTVVIGVGDGDSGGVFTWDAASGLRNLGDGAVSAVAARPDGQRALSCGRDGVLREWDLASRALVQALGGGDACEAVAYTSGGGVAVANTGWTPIAWDLSTGEALGRLEIAGPVDDVAISETGLAAVAGGTVEDGTLYTMNLKNGALAWLDPRESGVHLDTVGAVDFARDRGLVSGGWDGRIVQWRSDGLRGFTSRELLRRTPGGPAAFTADGRMVAVADDEGGLRLWDVNRLSVRARVPLFDATVGELALSEDGSRAVAAWERPRGTDEEVGLARVALVDTARGEIASKLDIPTDYVFGAAFTPDGRFVAVGDLDHLWVFDAASGARVADHAVSADEIRPGASGGELWVPSAEGWARIDPVTAATSLAVPVRLADGERLREAAISPDGQRVASIVGTAGFFEAPDLRVVITGIADGQVVQEWKVVGAGAIAWSPDGATLAVGEGPALGLWDVASGARRASWAGHAGAITALGFTSDGQHLQSAGADGTFRRWNLDGGWLAFVADGVDWLVWDDAGRFDASATGSSLVRAVRGTTSFAVDQVALERNRPDLLLERFGLGEQALVDHYRAVWERRMRRAGVDPAATGGGRDLPTVTLVKQTPSYAKDALDLVVDLRSGAGLRTWQVWVDDVPVFPDGGRPVEGLRARISEHVVLTGGDARVEVSVVDVAGRESLRAGVDVAPPREAPAALWYVGFGVSEYADPDLNDLRWAHQDALDLEAALKGATGFSAVHTRSWTDAGVNAAALAEAKAWLAGSKPGDTLVVFVAGHGVHDVDPAATYYYLVHDADPDDLAGTAAPFELVEALLDGTPARQKLFLLDTCQSGELDDLEALPALEAKAAGTSARAVRGVTVATARRSTVPRPWLHERDRFVYQDLVRRTGAIVFSSSRGSEYSLESDPWRNGAFTEAVLEALGTPVADADHDGMVQTAELRRYVAARVRALTKDAQHPTVDRDNFRQQFGFGVPATP